MRSRLRRRRPQASRTWDALPKITCPVLIVRGGDSESLLSEVAERTRTGLADALFVEIPDGTHFPFLERPRELTVLLRGFLSVIA